MAISGGDAILGRASVLLGPQVDPNFGRDAEKGILGPLQGLAGKVTGILAGAFAAREVFRFFKESAAAASENEKSVRLLEFSFKALGLTQADTAGAEKWIASMSKARGVLEDQLRPALSQALRFTHDLGQAEAITGLAQDIAIARGRDLGQVTTALGRASTGNVQILQRLGLAIKDSSGHTLSWTEAYKKLVEQFGGAGVAAMDTADGRARALGVAFHELKVQVGDLLLPVLEQIAQVLTDDVIPPIRAVIKVFGEVNGATDGWAGKIVALGGTLLVGAIAIAKIKTVLEVTRAALLGTTAATEAATIATGTNTAVEQASAVAAAELGLAQANLAVKAALTAAAIDAEQLSLLDEAAALGTVQLEMFPTTVATDGLAAAQIDAAAAARALAIAEEEAAAGAAAAKVSMISLLGIFGLVVTGAILIEKQMEKIGGAADNSAPHIAALKEELKNLTTPQEAAAIDAYMQHFAEGAKTLTDHQALDAWAHLHQRFEELVKTAPELAQKFLDAAKQAQGGTEHTKNWQAQLDKATAAAKTATGAVDDLTGAVDEFGNAVASVDVLDPSVQLSLIAAGAAGDAIRASMEAGKKATADYTQTLADHAQAYDDLVIAIGPYEAALAAAGGLTTEQMSDMAKAAEQFSTDFATALLNVSDPLSFFGDQTDVTAAQLQAFFDQTLAATEAWAQNLQFATAIGINEGFIQELAKAGPKSAPILRGILDLAAQSSVDVTNQLITGTRNVATISHNIWSGMSVDAILAARSMIHSVQDVLGWLGSLGAATGALLKGPAALVGLPTKDSVGVPKLPSGGGASSAITQATDAVAESLKRLQDQFKIGEITEQQLADQAGAMWADTEKFSSNWMAIWDILHSNAVHLQETADAAARSATDAADKAAKAAQDAADKAAKAAQDAADKIAAAAQRAAEEYQAAFDDIVAVLGTYGASVLKARGLSTDQLKKMAADVKSFQQAVASSFDSAASAVAAFGNQTEVTGQQLIDFQRRSLQDSIDWSRNIQKLMQMGLDPALLSPLAQAGPKAGSLVKAYIDEIGLIGVDAVNQMAKDQAAILAQTTAALSGAFVSAPGSRVSTTTPPQQITSTFTVQGSVYGVADLNAYMDQRDSMLAATIAAGVR